MLEKFKEIFKGSEIAYGLYAKGDRGANGKQKGKATIVREKVNDKLWSDHLSGVDPALGIIPITGSNTCKWGCIDIDRYDLDHKKIIKDIEFNYKKDKNRNKWSKESNLHHCYDDQDNLNFKKIKYDKLIPIYTKVFERFFNNLNLNKSLKFEFNIVNYTCMTSSQFMKEHFHPDTDFTVVHYIKFDKKLHKPTLFRNSNIFSS